MWTDFKSLVKLTDPQGALRVWYEGLAEGEPGHGLALRLEGRFAQSRAAQLLAALVHLGAIEPVEHDPGELTAQGLRDSMQAWTYKAVGPWPEEGAEYGSTNLLWEDRVGHWHVAKSTFAASAPPKAKETSRRSPWTMESYVELRDYHARRSGLEDSEVAARIRDMLNSPPHVDPCALGHE